MGFTGLCAPAHAVWEDDSQLGYAAKLAHAAVLTRERLEAAPLLTGEGQRPRAPKQTPEANLVQKWTENPAAFPRERGAGRVPTPHRHGLRYKRFQLFRKLF